MTTRKSYSLISKLSCLPELTWASGDKSTPRHSQKQRAKSTTTVAETTYSKLKPRSRWLCRIHARQAYTSQRHAHCLSSRSGRGTTNVPRCSPVPIPAHSPGLTPTTKVPPELERARGVQKAGSHACSGGPTGHRRPHRACLRQPSRRNTSVATSALQLPRHGAASARALSCTRPVGDLVGTDFPSFP